MLTRIIHQSLSLESMSATWLLPVVTLIVASSTGGILSNSLGEYSVKQALDTLTVSVFMVTVGLSLALMILVIYLQRLITFGIPSERSILSVFIPLGPTGQAGYSILLIGEGFRMLLPRAAMSNSYFLSDGSHTDNHRRLLHLFIVHSLVFGHYVDDLWIPRPIHQSASLFYLIQVTSWGLVFPNVRHILSVNEGNYNYD
jgi:tellurite resistance protein TehA-like permease